MKQLSLKFVVIILLSMVGVHAFAYDAVIDGIYYSFKDSEATVTSDNISSRKYSGSIVIPKTVLYNGITYHVTSIGSSAFYQCSNLTQISIPESIKEIGVNAFYGCTGLASVTIPENVNSVGSSAFRNCNNLGATDKPCGEGVQLLTQNCC